MNLHLEGAGRLEASREAVFEQLTNPSRIAQIIPWTEGTQVLDSKVEGKLDVPEAGGVFNVEVAVAELSPPSAAKLTSNGESSQTSLRVKAGFDLIGDSPTWIHWEADAELEGDTSKIDQRELKAVADRKASEMFADLTRAVQKP